MPSSERVPLWWDREIDDETGKPIRADIREAAHNVWEWVFARARQTLGDANDAPELLEKSIRAISRYLDKNNAPLYSSNVKGLLILACHRSLRRLATRRKRIQFIGESGELAQKLRAPDWRQETDHRLFLEDLARLLTTESRFMLRLKVAGYDWKEIARMMGTSASVARQRFWRDVRQAHLTLLRNTKPASPDKSK